MFDNVTIKPYLFATTTEVCSRFFQQSSPCPSYGVYMDLNAFCSVTRIS